jgi:hypothetical protein
MAEERSPVRPTVVVDFDDLDDDVIDNLRSMGAPYGVSPQEVLRRAIEEEMRAEGKVGATVVVRPAADECVDCHVQNPQVFFKSKDNGDLLCQSCFEARAATSRAKESET